MKAPFVFRIPWSKAEGHDPQQLLSHEWLVTNGLGGYASGTILGASTRRYHGLLIAALPAPLGRMMMFNHVVEQIRLPDGNIMPLGGAIHAGAARTVAGTLASFSLESGLPVWRYQIDSYVLERRVVLPYRANTVHLIYHLIAGDGAVRLGLRPGLHFRGHEASVSTQLDEPYRVLAAGNHFEINAPNLPSLKMHLSDHPGALVLDGGKFYELEYALERERGYAHRDVLWSPGYFRADLAPGQDVTLSASTESWDSLLAVPAIDALAAELERRQRLIEQAGVNARAGMAAELVLAADQFIITPTTRAADAARAHAAGDEIRSVIAGYHWFTDWGRDTMITLEGLTLVTGRHGEAGYILRTFAHYVRDGLIPNLFPEGEKEGLYHTADATLWFFHALGQYLKTVGDRATLRLLLPTLRDIVDHHLRGTRFGIGVDPADGLLREGQEGYQLTWMDAKVGDWVVTPRRGKAVEINALWYNALRLLGGWLAEEQQTAEAEVIQLHAMRARDSFNARFWCGERGWLYDVIDGEGPDDPSLRPNQLFAISLPHPVLDSVHWPAVVDVVGRRLLTPFGLRTLAPGEPNYKAKYDGDLRVRDAAYHQGTVWPWLIGPFIDAWLRVYPERVETAHGFLMAFKSHLGKAGVGSISEVCDAEEPYLPRGCIAQAWSVAEVLRTWIKTMPSEARQPLRAPD
jgi:predicted glycogen debranching enzyme